MKLASIIGQILIVFNLSLIYFNLELLYRYQNPNIYFFFMLPSWILLSNGMFGGYGAWIGVKLIRKRVSLKKALLVNLVIILVNAFGHFLFPLF